MNEVTAASSDWSLQLLAATIQHERPELEVRKTALLRQEEDLKIQLAKLEESLLEVRGHSRSEAKPPLVSKQ